MSITVAFEMQGQVKILTIDKRTAAPRVDYLPYTAPIFSDEFFEELRPQLAKRYAVQSGNRPQSVCVQLPNEAVGFETFFLPNMSTGKQMAALDTEIANEYGAAGVKERKINKFVITHNKQYTTLGAVYYNKALMGKIYKLLNEVRLIPVSTTYCGNALLNAVLALNPRARSESFVFADIRSDKTLIVVSAKGKNMGVAAFPHGTVLLSREERINEYMRTNHEAGELAVINARENARARALTVLDAEEMEEERLAEQAAIAENEAAIQEAERKEAEAAAAAEAPKFPRAIDAPEEQQAAQEAAAGSTLTEAAAPAAEDEDDEEAPRPVPTIERRVIKPKIYRKVPKRYPKFMQREMPTTPEGFMYENFLILAKWILVYARQAAITEYIAQPDYVLVNLSEEYRFLVDMFNKEQEAEGGVKLRLFTAADKQPKEIRNQLDLYGSTFAKQFNKVQNF